MSPHPEQFQFNPYVPFLRSGDRYSWRISLDREVPLPGDAESLVPVIEEGGTVSMAQLREHFDADRIVSLFNDRIVVDPVGSGADRYSRTQGYWSLVGLDAQAARLHRLSILVLGAGAIGSHAAWMLAALGVRRIVLVDFDRVEMSNLNRQVLYTVDDVGREKVVALAEHLSVVNPQVEVVQVPLRIAGVGDITDVIRRFGCHAVVKAIDTPEEATSWINRACVAASVPYVQGGFVGTTALIGPHFVPGVTPCWDCYDRSGAEHVHRLSGGGGTLPHLTEITAGKIVRDLVSILNGERVANPGCMEIYDERTNTSMYPPQTRVAVCPTCHARRGDRAPVAARRPFAVELLYLAGCGLLPILSGLPGWGAGWVVASLAALQLLLLAETTPARLFRLGFCGGSLYAVMLTALTVRERPSIVGIPSSGIDPVSILHVLLMIALVMAMVITVVQWMSVCVFALQYALGSRRRAAAPPPRHGAPRPPAGRLIGASMRHRLVGVQRSARSLPRADVPTTASHLGQAN